MSNEHLEQGPGPRGSGELQQSIAAQSEIESLQAEVAELRRQVAEASAVQAAKGHGWRRFAVVLLIVLGSIVAALGNVTLWVRDAVLDTDEWVATVAPLSQNDIIVDAVSLYVVGDVFEAIDVEQVARDVLPEEVSFLSRSLVGGLQSLVRDVVAELIKSDQFNAVWVAVNRTAHQVIVGALRHDSGLLYLKDGQLALDLREPFAFIEETLGLDGLNLFADEDWGEFVLLESHQVAMVQQVLGMLNAVGLLLPLVALILYVIAWLISLWRRRTVQWIGVAVAITMALSLVAYALTKPVLLASIVNPLMRAVGGEIWDVVTRRLVGQTIFVLVVGLILAGAAVLAGPHPRAVAFREGVRKQVSRLTK